MSGKRITNAPVSVQLLLTRRCNLACTYCGVEQLQEKEIGPELSTKEWINVLERLKEIQVFQLDFSGGEIFMRKDALEILEKAARCRFPKLTVITNGTLINATVAEELKRLNIKNIAVSLDGDEESHDHLRGTNAFGKTIAGIHNLVEKGITPEILFTPLKSNFRRIGELVDLLYPIGVRRLSFNALHPTGRCKKNYNDVVLDTFADSEEFNGLIETVRKKYRNFKIAGSALFFHSYPREYELDKASFRLVHKERKYLKSCSAAHASCNITASGWVIPCSELYEFNGGNIREQDILEIWKNSENFEKIRNLANISTAEIPYCKNCDYNIYCTAGCRADAYAVYGDLLAPHPFCPYWKKN